MLKALNAPSKYIQGQNAIEQASQFISAFGSKALVITDPSVLKLAEEKLLLKSNELEYVIEKFGGECSKNEIDRLRQVALSSGAKVIVGFGGGKTLDTAKAVAYYEKLPVAILPSIASTDAPCSALSVIYTDDGKFEEYLLLPKNPELVLVDTSVVVKAPVRFLVAGMGDALATKFEAEASSKKFVTTMAGGVPSVSAMTLANLCYEQLLEYGYAAKTAAEKGVITPAVERIVEANTLLSGLGFESGGLGAAHAIHNGFTALDETHHYYHGEKVAFSTIVQLIMEDRPIDEIYEVIYFCQAVGLPTTLAQLGLANVSPERLKPVAEAAVAPGETIHNMPFPVNAQMVLEAIIAADALGNEISPNKL